MAVKELMAWLDKRGAVTAVTSRPDSAVTLEPAWNKAVTAVTPVTSRHAQHRMHSADFLAGGLTT